MDLTEALSWRSPLLEFSETPLTDAVAQVNRYGGPSAKVADPAVASLRVTGQFRAGDPTRFASSLAAPIRSACGRAATAGPTSPPASGPRAGSRRA